MFLFQKTDFNTNFEKVFTMHFYIKNKFYRTTRLFQQYILVITKKKQQKKNFIMDFKNIFFKYVLSKN